MPPVRTRDAITMRQILIAIDDTTNLLAAAPGWGDARGNLQYIRNELLKAAIGDVAVAPMQAA